MATYSDEQRAHLQKNKGLVILTVMMVAILEVLDSTIVNVSLPHMMGELGANTEQITWVLTSYIVASAIIMPLTGLLEHRIGRKQLLLINITGFMLSSVLCGLSSSLEMMVTCRILQGMFGAALIPLSQVMLVDTFDKKEQTKAMAIWGVGLMAAPVLGPTLGGYITEHLNWRWVFYINLPGCLISLLLASWIIPKTAKRARKIDWLGMVLMAVAVGGLQLVLDQGNSKDWFSSNMILISTIVTLTAIMAFFIRGIGKPNHIINLRLFSDRNFTTATLMMALFCAAIFGNIGLQPILLENIMGYPAVDTGLLMGPRGIACAVAMGMVAPLMQRLNGKTVLLLASLFSAYGTWEMTHYTATMNTWAIIWPTIVQGFGMGLFFVPLSALALANIRQEDQAEAAGLFGYGRMLGSSIGISIMSTLLSRQTQVHWHQMSAQINPTNPNLQKWLIDRHLALTDPVAIKHVVTQTATQANLIAYLDSFVAVAIAFLALIPLVLMLKTLKGPQQPTLMH